MTSDQSLPRWDMSSIYPSLDSAEFEEDLASAINSIGKLAKLFDRHGIERREPRCHIGACSITTKRAKISSNLRVAHIG